jgi:hypothetical protein
VIFSLLFEMPAQAERNGGYIMISELGVAMCRNVEEYISIVLSQIDCAETKR